MTLQHAKQRPTHIAVIPDGNRRWALARGLGKEEGYAHGLNPGLALFDECLDLGIKEITFYGFTSDNTKRPSKQTQAFRQTCVEAVRMMADREAEVLVVGNSASLQFPSELHKYRKRQPSGRNLMKINFLINYDWHWDMNVALSASSPHGQRSQLLQAIGSSEIPRIDLIIRWGGRRRLSGMLPLQTVYSDFYVVDDLWPDFSPMHLKDALHWYAQQDVTLGG